MQLWSGGDEISYDARWEGQWDIQIGRSRRCQWPRNSLFSISQILWNDKRGAVGPVDEKTELSLEQE